MSGSDLVVGPLRVGSCDVLVRTDDADFARVAGHVFGGLTPPGDAPPATHGVVFDTMRHTGPTVHWSVHRDGQPCELQLRHDAVLVHQQWELNRLAIELQATSIHAAAVAVDGRAALLAGRSMSGKTTLAGWLAVHHGAGFVADEVSAIDRQLRVLPYARPLGLRAGGPLVAGGPSVDAPAHGFMPDERLVPVVDLGGALCDRPTPVRLVVFPTFDAGAGAEVRRVDEADALERLVELTPGVVRHGRAVFERLARLVATTPAITVRYGDVGSIAAAVVAELAGAEPA